MHTILPAHSIAFLEAGQPRNLAQLYHDLEADAEMQKAALLEGKILLSPWELLILTLFKALTECSFVPDLQQEYIYSIDLTA